MVLLGAEGGVRQSRQSALEEGADGENRLMPSVDSPQEEERYVLQFLSRNLPITSLNLVIVITMDENMLLCFTS